MATAAVARAAVDNVDDAWGWQDSVIDYPSSAMGVDCADIHLRDDSGKLYDEGGKEFRWHAYQNEIIDTSIKIDDGVKCLQFDLDPVATGVMTRVMSVLPRPDAALKRVPIAVTNEGACGFYADAELLFEPFTELSEPQLSADDKITVWIGVETEEDGALEPSTNLYVTAGCYVNSFLRCEKRRYLIAVGDDFDFFAWHRVTIRSLNDITEGGGILGFTVAIDGKLVAIADEEQAIMKNFSAEDQLTPEARDLKARRMLFPALTPARSDAALFTYGPVIAGRGSLKSLEVTTNAPAFIAPEAVFTLYYDAGVTNFSYSLNGGDKVMVENLGARAGAIEFPLRGEAQISVKITDVLYRKDLGFTGSHGLWYTENDCVLSGMEFSYNAEAALSLLPRGYIAAERIGIAVSGVDVDLQAAFDEAIKRGTNSIYLAGDAYVTTGLELNNKNARNAQITIDLNGHQLVNRRDDVPTIANFADGSVLKIIDSDSMGRGRVVPYLNFFEDSRFPQTEKMNDLQHIVVWNRCNKGSVPHTEIYGGIFDGYVINSIPTNTYAGAQEGAWPLKIYGGSFISTNAFEFSLEDELANQKTYYGYEAPYWKPVIDNAYIWTGACEATNAAGCKYFGEPENWKCHEVPGDGALVVFREAAEPWRIDLDNGKAVSNSQWWICGDVELHGSNENFSVVNWRAHQGPGRISGDALLVFKTNSVAKLDLSTLLATNWAGTVKISPSENPRAEALASVMDTWGVAGSTVVLNGVRGAVSDRYDHYYPFTLVLEDNGEWPAWRNDGGYNGSILTFARIEGSGMLMSPKNTVAIKQVMRFLDVRDFTGKFIVGGKRFQLGEGTPATSVDVGTIVYANDIWVRSGLGWEATNVVFGAKLNVLGATNDVLLTTHYGNKTPPVIDGTVAFVTNAVEQLFTTNLLVFAPWNRDQIVFTNDSSLSVIDGEFVVKKARAKAFSAMSFSSSTSLKLSEGMGVEGDKIVENGKAIKTVPAYYTPSVNGSGVVTFELNEEALPIIGGDGESAVFTPDEGADGMVIGVAVSGTHKGLYYGLQVMPELGGEWINPDGWNTPENEGDAIQLIAPCFGDSCFYRVIVTDNPDKYASEEDSPSSAPAVLNSVQVQP